MAKHSTRKSGNEGKRETLRRKAERVRKYDFQAS